MDKTGEKPRFFYVELIVNTIKGKTWSYGTDSRLPFGVNVTLNLSIG